MTAAVMKVVAWVLFWLAGNALWLSIAYLYRLTGGWWVIPSVAISIVLYQPAWHALDDLMLLRLGRKHAAIWAASEASREDDEK